MKARSLLVIISLMLASSTPANMLVAAKHMGQFCESLYPKDGGEQTADREAIGKKWAKDYIANAYDNGLVRGVSVTETSTPNEIMKVIPPETLKAMSAKGLPYLRNEMKELQTKVKQANEARKEPYEFGSGKGELDCGSVDEKLESLLRTDPFSLVQAMAEARKRGERTGPMVWLESAGNEALAADAELVEAEKELEANLEARAKSRSPKFNGNDKEYKDALDASNKEYIALIRAIEASRTRVKTAKQKRGESLSALDKRIFELSEFQRKSTLLEAFDALPTKEAGVLDPFATYCKLGKKIAAVERGLERAEQMATDFERIKDARTFNAVVTECREACNGVIPSENRGDYWAVDIGLGFFAGLSYVRGFDEQAKAFLEKNLGKPVHATGVLQKSKVDRSACFGPGSPGNDVLNEHFLEKAFATYFPLVSCFDNTLAAGARAREGCTQDFDTFTGRVNPSTGVARASMIRVLTPASPH